ncbi:MAG: hypothetical protein ACTSUK_06845 [Promethearchaeota archaeon]
MAKPILVIKTPHVRERAEFDAIREAAIRFTENEYHVLVIVSEGETTECETFNVDGQKPISYDELKGLLEIP